MQYEGDILCNVFFVLGASGMGGCLLRKGVEVFLAKRRREGAR